MTPERAREYVRQHYGKTPTAEIARKLNKSTNAIHKIAQRLGIKNPHAWQNQVIIDSDSTTEDTDVKKPEDRPKWDDRGEYVINWENQTVITDLGEFGNYTCSITTHGAIQRAYVESYEGKGDTASEVATRFDFAHAKAVYKYAKIHGFTKSSLGQTDIEFEMGLSPEEAEAENIQAMKRRAMKLTEKAKWRETQKAADRWNSFLHTTHLPVKDWVEANLPTYRPPKFKPRTRKVKKAWVVGVSDWHFMKMAFDHEGNQTYNKEIAAQALADANNALITEGLLFGKPEMIYLPVGTDNLHVDNPNHTTTRGTPQVGQTDGGLWPVDFESYVHRVVGMIELYAQIGPVTVISVPGNHDKHTSMMMHVFLMELYRKRKDVTVLRNFDPYIYVQYGNNAFGFTHGDGMSLSRMKKEAHKHFLHFGRSHGVDMSVMHRALFTGHIHFDHYEDLGELKHFIIPSLSPPDSWHKESGFVGPEKEASLYLFDKEDGRSAIMYS